MNAGYDTEMQHAEKCPKNQVCASSSHEFWAIEDISSNEIRIDKHSYVLLQ